LKPLWTHTLRQQLLDFADGFGKLLVDAFHYLALFAIGGAIIWSAFSAFVNMGSKGHATIDDILLLFIYLELGAMVGIYFKTNHMPVRFLLYVAMTALAHQMISVVQAHGTSHVATGNVNLDVLIISIAMLVLAIATLVIRFGSARFPVVRDSADEKSTTH
jgi:phosphate starvation-inducible membrane PsiE